MAQCNYGNDRTGTDLRYRECVCLWVRLQKTHVRPPGFWLGLVTKATPNIAPGSVKHAITHPNTHTHTHIHTIWSPSPHWVSTQQMLDKHKQPGFIIIYKLMHFAKKKQQHILSLISYKYNHTTCHTGKTGWLITLISRCTSLLLVTPEWIGSWEEVAVPQNEPTHIQPQHKHSHLH